MKLSRILLLAFTVALATLSSAQAAEWKKIGSFPGRISVIYFYNETLGFVCIGTVPGSKTVNPAIFRTTDAGTTWIQASTPGGNGFGVNDIFMESELEGFATGDNVCGLIWRTTDGGATWVVVSDRIAGDHLGNSIRRTKLGLVISDFLSQKIYLSTDEGKTLRPVYSAPKPEPVLGMDFVDSVHGVAVTSFRTQNKWAYTNDGGNTWKESNFSIESWSVKGMKGTSTFFATPEGYSNTDDYLTDVMRSDDYGATWYKVHTFPFRVTSDIEFNGNVLYVQSGLIGCKDCTFPQGRGMYRSTDSGATWLGIGGPEYWSDSRFAVTKSCQGSVVYCADKSSNVYRGVDTIEHLRPKSDAELHTAFLKPDILELTSCMTDFAYARIQIDECYKLVVTSLELEGRDASRFSISHTRLPFVLSGDSDSIRVNIQRNKAGEYIAQLRIHGYYDYGSGIRVPFDTLLDIKARVSRSVNLVADRSLVIFDTVTECQHNQDTTIKLTNLGCDTVTITAGPGDLSAYFLCDSLSFPILLAPGASTFVRFHFTPDTLGSYAAGATFSVSSYERVETFSVGLRGVKSHVPPKLAARNTAIDFLQFTLCDPGEDSLIVLENTGCDTLQIVAVYLPPQSEFSIDTPVLPIVLAPKETVSIRVKFLPASVGSFKTSINFVAENHGIHREYAVTIRGSATARRPRLEVVPASLDFGTISTCDAPHDTTVTLTNSGCDSLTITEGPGNIGNGFSIDTLHLPITLAPGESITLRCFFRPPGVGTFRCTPEFVADRFGSKTLITFFIEAAGSEGVGVLAVEPRRHTFPPMLICASTDSLIGAITNSGCDDLIVDQVLIPAEQRFSVGSLNLPATLMPGDTLHYKLYFTPLVKGEVEAAVTIKAHTAHYSKKSYTEVIPISARVGDGTRTLAVRESHIDFGTTTLCTDLDSTITLANNGCDTLTVFAAVIGGSGFVIDETLFPLIILPGAARLIPIGTIVDTVGHKFVSEASISFVSNADTEAASLSLTRQYVYRSAHQLKLLQSKKQDAEGRLVFFDLVMDNIPSGLQTIDIDIDLNADLLEFANAFSDNEVDFTDGHIRIVGNAEITAQDDVLATLAFTTYLTDDSISAIVLSNPRLNAHDASYEQCIANAATNGNSYTYLYECGDRTLINQLRRNKPFAIESVRPNPASSFLLLDLTSKFEGMFTVRIFDAVGNMVSHSDGLLLTARTYRQDITNLLSGTYFMKVTSSGHQEVISFTKIR